MPFVHTSNNRSISNDLEFSLTSSVLSSHLLRTDKIALKKFVFARMKRNLIYLLLICACRIVVAGATNNDGLYDGSEIDFDLSDMEDDPFDSITDNDETRQYMGPIRRRRRLRKLQGKYFLV